MLRHWQCLPSPRRGESFLDRLTRADPEAGHSLAAALDDALGPYDEAKVRAAERKANRRSHFYGYEEDEDEEDDDDDDDEDYEEILYSVDAAGSKRKRAGAPGPHASTAPAAALKRAPPLKGPSIQIPATLTGVELRNNVVSASASSTVQPGSVIKTPSSALSLTPAVVAPKAAEARGIQPAKTPAAKSTHVQQPPTVASAAAGRRLGSVPPAGRPSESAPQPTPTSSLLRGTGTVRVGESGSGVRQHISRLASASPVPPRSQSEAPTALAPKASGGVSSLQPAKIPAAGSSKAQVQAPSAGARAATTAVTGVGRPGLAASADSQAADAESTAAAEAIVDTAVEIWAWADANIQGILDRAKASMKVTMDEARRRPDFHSAVLGKAARLRDRRNEAAPRISFLFQVEDYVKRHSAGAGAAKATGAAPNVAASASSKSQ